MRSLFERDRSGDGDTLMHDRWTKFAAALVVLVSFGLASCETIKGVGRDIESTGEILEKTIEE